MVSILLKRLRLWPALGVLGARQTGKSTLLRDQISSKIGAVYHTMDNKELRAQAEKRPDYFLDSHSENPSHSSAPLIIDEVQKVPDLFDAIKLRVDENRRPGRFILSGSTEFSRKTGIRESLTGRIGILRLYPLTLTECENKSFSSPWVDEQFSKISFSTSLFQKRVRHGGMPGICFLRSEDERQASFDSWLETTCYRDLQQVKGMKLEGDLAMQILSILPKLEEPSVSEVAAALKKDSRKIKRHLEALESLFVVSRLNAHHLGVGKSHYYLFDSGLCHHLGGNNFISLKTCLLHECLAQHEYSGVKVKISHYRSSRRSMVDWVLEKRSGTSAYIVTEDQAPGTYVFRTAEAFLKKSPASMVFIIAPIKESYKEHKKLHVIPYESVI